MEVKIKILNLFFLTLCCMQITEAFAQGDMATPEVLSKLKSNQKSNTNLKVKPKPKSKDAGQSALIKVDGSAIYEYPNFDSPVIEYMDRSKKVKISKKIYPGIGGLGAFYKIRVKKGVYGFIADTDAEVTGKKLSEKGKSDDDDEDDQKLEEEGGADPTQLQSSMYGDSDESEVKDSFYLTRYVGFSYATYNYAEVLRSQTEVAQTAMLGAKISGPLGVMGGIPLDVNILFATAAPDFYGEIASSTSGYMIISDALVTLPLYESKSALVYYGFGAMLRYSSWRVQLKNQPNKAAVDSQEIGIGAAAMAGAAFRLGQKFVLRGDGRYYYEKEKYFGYGLALQFKY